MAEGKSFPLFRRIFIGLLLVLILPGDMMIFAHIIQTRLGLLEGVTKEARTGKLFHAYYGVPYGKPPIEELRFEPPVAADPWSGIFNATQQPEPCPQIDEDSEMYRGFEDCLYMHIYTPTNLKPGSNLPVIFYIFGGGYKNGNALREGPEFLMSRDIILVMVTYRLGPLGLFSTGDSVIPGNMALKDQTLAMKWVNENIYEFGGDPHRVTIQGHSSGAMSVHLHTLSPLSRRYYNPDSSILNVNNNLLLPIIGCFDVSAKPNHLNFITRVLKTHFLGEEDVNNTTEIADVALVEILTGIMFGSGFIHVVQKYEGPIYAYLFDYRYVGGYTHSAGGRNNRFLGVSHGDDLALLFKKSDNSTWNVTEKDYAFGDEMITRVINFVYSGNPNVPFPINVDVLEAWSPISSPRIEFLRILNGGGMEKDYFIEKYGYLRKLPILSKYTVKRQSREKTCLYQHN